MRLWLFSGASIVVAVVACSGSTSSPPTAQQACNDLATSICNGLETCYPYGLTVAYGNTSTCITRAALDCPSAITATGSGATAADVEACAQAYSGASCEALLNNGTPSACQIPGTLAAGSPCGSDVQCAGSNAYCKVATGSCGVCSTRAAGGGTCTAGNDCQPGLSCVTSGTTSTCVAPAAQGASCSATTPCQASLACINGTCGQPLAAGAACTQSADTCNGAQGYYCSPANVCAQVQIAAAGQPCGLSGSTITECSEGTCKTAAGTETGTVASATIALP